MEPVGHPSATDGAPTSTGMVLGTPAYLAPERLAGKPATPASDVWSVGVVCWEALAGHRAYPDGTAVSVGLAVMTTDLPPVRSVRPDADVWLARAIDGALQRDPAARWASAATMRDVLVGGVSAGGASAGADATQPEGVPVMVAAPATVAEPVAARRARPSPLLGVVAALLVAAIAVVAVTLVRDRLSNTGPGSGIATTSTTTAPPPTAPATTTQTVPAAPVVTSPPATSPPTTAATTTEAPTTVPTTTPPTSLSPTTVSTGPVVTLVK
jgi:serine/threonine protein kinase